MDSIAMGIRQAEPADEPYLVELGERAGMGELEDFEDTLVAQAPDGSLLGFCRLRTFDGVTYVNPIVISENARGMGVGSALMSAASKSHGELRFVARGNAVPFYESLGCVAVPWNMICDEVASDCDHCEDRQRCRPLPMSMPA